MKQNLLVVAAVLLSSFTYAQEALTPENIKLDASKIKDQSYQQKWFFIRDTTKMEIGSIKVDINKKGDELTVITHVELNQMKGATWVDSAVAKLPYMAPVYHSSYNPQRDMVLHYGDDVTGYYLDKSTNTKTEINDAVEGKYFDSNLYTNFIPWLPLNEGYQTKFTIYDYNPSASGLMTAVVSGVEKGEYRTEKAGKRPVWVVTVSDNIGGGKNDQKLYIDQETRQIWQQQISAGGRLMLLKTVED
ncbi:DUF3108 domain-containing protein [Fulvivirga ligni]|uniref:DUF3108 domain-containing protein n=1 Tax=Fulvivirga ligni TaxID=2904246 RepID=UPI001F2AB79D|nr:hypothetical protein [Fulvivirga ligni]UII23179.1 hypothetical protein LVD16_08060 [Fulvivirga ligni]